MVAKNCLFQVVTPVTGLQVSLFTRNCLFQFLTPVIGRHVDKGARLSELLLAMLILALDLGKWS